MSKTMLTQEAIWSLRINVTEGEKDKCWNFLNIEHSSYFHPAGYGIIRYYENNKSIRFLAHRIAYMYHHNIQELDESIMVLHHCDNTSCCNPHHLFLGDNQTNSDDKVSKGRQQHGETHSFAQLTEDDVRLIRKLHSRGIGTTELSKRFGTNPPNIGHIVKRRSWRHIE